MSSNILYIGMFIDSTGRELGIKDKKIGITGGGKADIFSRANQLSRTKSPIQWVPLKAWEFDGDVKPIEAAIHSLLCRRNTEGEWFDDEDETLLNSMTLLMEALKTGHNIKEIELEGRDKEETNASKKTRKAATSEHRNLINTKEMAGTEVFANRYGDTLKVTILGDGMFKNDREGVEYNSLNKAFLCGSKILAEEAYGLNHGKSLSINVWTAKDSTGKALDDLCMEIYKGGKR